MALPSSSVLKRLLGPFYRESAFADKEGVDIDEKTFDRPLGAALDYVAEQKIVRGLLDAFGASLLAGKNQSRTTAEAWLEAIRYARENNLALFIDRNALEELRSSARTTPPLMSEDAYACAQEWFFLQGLAIVLGDGCAVVTGQSDVALRHAELTMIDSPLLWRTEAGPWRTRLRQLADREGDRRFLEVSKWLSSQNQDVVKENGADRPSRYLGDSQGWKAVRLLLGEKESPVVRYYYRPFWLLMAWLLFAAAATGGGLGFLGRPRCRIYASSGIGLAAILLPTPLAIVAGAVFLGLVSQWLFLFVRTAVAATRRKENGLHSGSEIESDSQKTLAHFSDASAARVKKTFILLLCAAAIQGSAVAKAQTEKNDQKNGNISVDYQVFDPVDANRKPVGDAIYLSESFYKELLRLAAEKEVRPHDWMITESHYRGKLTRQSDSGRVSLIAISVRHHIKTLGRSVEVGLAMPRDYVQENADVFRLDGKPVAAEWDAAGRRCSIMIAEPGEYDLDVDLKPMVQINNGYCLAEMPIVPVVRSRLELELPSPPPGVEALSALGTIETSRDGTRLDVSLGPTNRFILRWPEAAARNSETTLRASSFAWLKVQPGAAVLDIKYKLNADKTPLQQLRIRLDPRWRLLSAPAGDDVDLLVSASEEQSRILTAFFAAPFVGEKELVLSFLLANKIDAGEVRLPELELLDFPLDDKWLAVSINPYLEHRERFSDDWKDKTPSEFLRHWDEPIAPPLLAYRYEKSLADWSIQTQPRRNETTVRQTTRYYCGDERIAMLWRAEAVSNAGVFFGRIVVPSGVDVQSVAVKKGDQKADVRWTRDGDSVGVFMKSPVEDRFSIEIAGSMPMDVQQSFLLPECKLEDARLESAKAEIFRTGTARVELVSCSAKEDSATIADASATDKERLVHVFSSGGEEKMEIRLRSKSEPIRYGVDQAVVYRSPDRGMSVKDALHFHLLEGDIEEFSLTLPPTWKEPFSIEPAGEAVVKTTPDGTRRLHVRFESPLHDEADVILTGKWNAGPGWTQAAPKLDSPATGRVWIVLPKPDDAIGLRCETRGFDASALDERFVRLLQNDYDSQRTKTYVVEAESEISDAAFRYVRSTSPKARVRLADVRLKADTEGEATFYMSFDIEPGGLTECPVVLPDRAELISAKLDDMPAELLSLHNGRGWIRLHSDTWPGRLALLIRIRMEPSENVNERVVLLPRLGDLPVDRTLCELSLPPSLSPSTASGVESISVLDRDLFLAETAVAIPESFDLMMEEQEEFATWFSVAKKRFGLAKRALDAFFDANPRSGSSEMNRSWRELDRRTMRMFENFTRFVASDKKEFVSSRGKEPAFPTDVIEQSERFYLSISGGTQAVRITVVTSYPEKLKTGFAVVFFVIASVVALRWERRGVVKRLAEDYPFALTILGGVFWCLWLQPAWIGWLIIAGSVSAWFYAAREIKSRS